MSPAVFSWRNRQRLALMIVFCPALSACVGKDPVRLESSLKGDLATTIKLEGPIQFQAQLQGPTIKYEGTYISDELLEQVEVSKTTSDWILAVFGKADAESPLKDGTEIWRWTYRPVEQQASMVELWTKTEKEPKLATRGVFIQFRDGVVVRKWKG